MDVKDARKIVAVMMVSFPSYKPIETELAAIELSKDLDGYSYQQVDTALRMYKRSNTSGFAPTSGQLISMLHMVERPQQLNEMEAWSLVSKALRNSVYKSEEEFDKLPQIVQKVVGSPNQLRTWAMDDNYNESVISSNFIKTYRVVAKREEEISKMPDDVARLIRNMDRTSYLPNTDKKEVEMINSKAIQKQGENEAVGRIESNVNRTADRYIKHKIDKLMEDLS